MKLSPEEEAFLRHWIYDEAHYQDGAGPAKRLQVRQGVPPADLATLIAAGMPDPAEQEAAGRGPAPTEAPHWPWSDEAFRTRLGEARAFLEARHHGPASRVEAGRARPSGNPKR
jgi:hypothetical protein